MTKFIFRYRLFMLLILIIAALLITACGAVEKAEVAGMEAAVGAIGAATWDDLLVNFTSNPLFCGAPGAVLLVDSPQGRFLEATGVSSIEEETPMQVSDAFEIGSVTKSFTAAVALQLQEEGVLSLDDPLSQWLPELAAQVPNGDQMTLRQLANHTTGIWDYGDPILEAGMTDTSLLQQGFTPEELIAYGRSDEEIGEIIGADWLVYQDLDDLVACSHEGNPGVDGFDCSVFTGEYITGDVDQGYLDRVESLRNDEAQAERRAALQAEGAVVGLHNDA